MMQISSNVALLRQSTATQPVQCCAHFGMHDCHQKASVVGDAPMTISFGGSRDLGMSRMVPARHHLQQTEWRVHTNTCSTCAAPGRVHAAALESATALA